MSDHRELKKLLEYVVEFQKNLKTPPDVEKFCRLTELTNPAAMLALIAEVEALRDALCGVMEQVEGNIRVTVRDCVNGMDDVQDIYEYCDNIESIVDLALSKGANP